MSKLSRTKGAAFERLVANLYRKRWPEATVYRSQQADRAYQSDVVVTGHPVASRLWTECCHGDAVSSEAKLEQAERDVEAGTFDGLHSFLPVVVWRKTGARSINVTMRLWVLTALTDPDMATRTYGAEEELVVTMGFAKLLEVLR